MTRRDRNIVKSCNTLDAIADLLSSKHGRCNKEALAGYIKEVTHRIKRAVWRGEKKVTIEQVADAFSKDQAFRKACKKIKTMPWTYIKQPDGSYNQHSTDY